MSLLLLFDDFQAAPPAARTAVALSEPEVRTHRLLFEGGDFIPAARLDRRLTEPEVRTHRLLFEGFDLTAAKGVTTTARARLQVSGVSLVIPTGVRVTVETMRPRWQPMRPHE